MQHEENSYWREANTARGAGYETRDLLEDMLSRPAGAGEGFSLEREVAARPLLAFGAAVAAGFLLGSQGDTVGAPDNRGHRWLAPLDRELELLKGAAMATITAAATENIRQMVPGETGAAITSMIRRKLQDMGVPAGQSGFGGQTYSQGNFAGQSDVGGGFGGTPPSSAPNASFRAGAGADAVGYDSPPPQGSSDRPIAGGPTLGTDKPDDMRG